MAANGGGIKNDEESFDSNKQILIENDDDQHRHVQLINNNNINNNNNNNNKGISIAERRAAKCGFNASTITADRFRPTRSQPYFTVPPGISPSALLDSPVMLPNVQAQLSPTTGTFQFSSPNDHENGSLKLNLKLGSNGDETMSMESSSLSALRVDNVALEELDLQEMSKGECFDDQVLGLGNKSVEVESGNSKNPMAMMSSGNHQQEHSGSTGTGQERSTHPNNNNISKEVGAYKYSEDGFFWRKYGQKHVKGSEFPRSYYKCTNTNCLVRKKVERSHDGQITEIVYRGSHNHPKPHNFKRSSTEMTETVQGTSSRPAETTDWRSPPTSFLNDFPADPLSRSMTTTFEPQFEASPESISVNDDDDDENAEFEPKKRKRDNIPNETAVARSTREPKVVVQIESEIDILDDGYRWRKYGQKVVKGNPNPRSYYKCTTPGCPVRKHVERAANDIKSVITTYEGKHNHQVPSSKTAGSLVINSDVANNNNNNNNNNISPNSSNVCTMAHKADDPKLGRQVQDLPVFMDRKPILSYNELIMRSNHHLGSFNLGSTPSSSSAYPVSFPPFNSLPYSSLLMNNNRMKTIYPFSKTYPTVSDYVNHVLGSTTTLAAGNFNYNNNNNNTNNNYPAAPLVQTRTSTGGHEMIDCHVVVKPKEEQRDEAAAGVLVYENRLPVPSHGNGSEAYN